jgi:uncharacterized protein (DUF302 family)
MATIGLVKQVPQSFDAVVAKLAEVLKTEGFGILTTVDIQKTLKEKLGADFRRYTIFGACNPQIANRALSAHLEFGLMMPCNVVVHEVDGGQTLVRAIDPLQTFAKDLGADALALATEVRTKLVAALERL